MNSSEKTELFENMPVPKASLRLAVPCVVSSLVMILYNLADTYFVGMLNDSLQNAAVTLTAPVILAFNAVNNLFGVGSGSRMSRLLGLKDHEGVRRTAAFGFYLSLLASALISAASLLWKEPLLSLLGARPENMAATGEYLFWTVTCGAVPAILNVVMANMVRAEGSAFHAAVGTMSGCILNIILDPVFILPGGLGMGAAGAGLATFLSNSAALLYYLVLLRVRRGRTFVSVSFRHLAPAPGQVRDVFGVGVPAAIQNLLNVTGMTILNNMMAEFGSAAVSAAGIAHKITMIPMYISMGVTQGVMALIGYNFAARNAKRMKEAIRFTLKLSIVFEVAVTALYFIFAEQIMGMFSQVPDILSYGTAFTRGMCLAQPFLALDFLAVAVFQACGMGARSLLFAVLRKIVLEIPALYILNALFPMYGMAYAQLCAELVLAAAALFLLRKVFREASGWTAKAE